VELFAIVTTTLFATVKGPADEALYPAEIVQFSVRTLEFSLMIPYRSAERYGFTETLSPRYLISTLLVPDGGGAENIICPLFREYVYDACTTPEMDTMILDSLPVR
jgi:hypothetical protein